MVAYTRGEGRGRLTCRITETEIERVGLWGPGRNLPEARTYEGREDLTGMTGNVVLVHSVEQKFIVLKFSKWRTGSHETYSSQQNLSRFVSHILVQWWRFCVTFIKIKHTSYILTENNNTFANFQIKTLSNHINFPSVGLARYVA